LSCSSSLYLLIVTRTTTPFFKPRNAHRSTLKHGRQACSNTISANHILPPPCHQATSARSYRIRRLHHEEALPTSDTKNLLREEVPLMSETMGRRLHGQHTLPEHRAALATIASRTASRVRADNCLFLCDPRHRHRTDQIPDLSREGRRSTVDCRLRRGGCTVTCSS
jgi:hypothetical protein